MLFWKEGNLKNDNLLFHVKVMFCTAQLILQPAAGNMPPPPVLEIHLILLWEQNWASQVLDFAMELWTRKQNASQWKKRVTFEVTGEAIHLIKLLTTRKEARKKRG